jgi:hypothetical protein
MLYIESRAKAGSLGCSCGRMVLKALLIVSFLLRLLASQSVHFNQK